MKKNNEYRINIYVTGGERSVTEACFDELEFGEIISSSTSEEDGCILFSAKTDCYNELKKLAKKYPALYFDMVYSSSEYEKDSGWYELDYEIDSYDNAHCIKDGIEYQLEILSRTWGKDIFSEKTEQNDSNIVYLAYNYLIHASFDDEGCFRVSLHEKESGVWVDLDGYFFVPEKCLTLHESLNQALPHLNLPPEIESNILCRCYLKEIPFDEYDALVS